MFTVNPFCFFSGNGGFKERVDKANFSEMFDPSKEFTFTIANMDYLSNLMKSKVSFILKKNQTLHLLGFFHLYQNSPK